MSVVITQLLIYPIKSCAAISLENMPLDALGAVNDRRYMLVDEQGCFVTQRQHAKLVFVKVTSDVSGWNITVPEQPSKLLPFNGIITANCMVKIWQDNFLAYDQGDEWAILFSQFLEKTVRLVFTDIDTQRLIDQTYSLQARPVSFTDGFPLLITNETSLLILNQQLQTPIDMLRFRPNIVVSGAQAFAENQWQQLSTKEVTLAIVKPCSRCVIPTININTGKKEPNVWQVLAQNCRAEDGNIYFGQNVIHQSEGVLRLGDVLKIGK